MIPLKREEQVAPDVPDRREIRTVVEQVLLIGHRHGALQIRIARVVKSVTRDERRVAVMRIVQLTPSHQRSDFTAGANVSILAVPEKFHTQCLTIGKLAGELQPLRNRDYEFSADQEGIDVLAGGNA